jgi:hypothetical protein
LRFGENLSEKEIVVLARGLSAKRKHWHHHYLPPRCGFNASGRKHLLVLEDEGSGKVFHSTSARKPFKALQTLEGLFFGRIKANKTS